MGACLEEGQGDTNYKCTVLDTGTNNKLYMLLHIWIELYNFNGL